MSWGMEAGNVLTLFLRLQPLVAIMANNMIPRIHQGFVIQNVQLKDELLSVLESNSGQDNAPLSAKRRVERRDYKKLHDEAYGNVSSDSSDDEDLTENVIPRKRKI
uniref:Uncharacterized protein n=2 Tax=Vitis vinifera TaxID=29760 RepID=A5BJY8_VITVI|nr:hypothetical protein VITISV_037273 [Vitis vinifera]